MSEEQGQFDAVIYLKGRPLAVEFDGPQHFLFKSQKPTGPTNFKRRMAKLQGTRLLSIPYWVWDGAIANNSHLETLRSLVMKNLH